MNRSCGNYPGTGGLHDRLHDHLRDRLRVRSAPASATASESASASAPRSASDSASRRAPTKQVFRGSRRPAFAKRKREPQGPQRPAAGVGVRARGARAAP